MSSGLASPKHIVVLMMSGRSFDHMLGGLKAADPRIDGLLGNESNIDSTGATVKVEPLAAYQGLDPKPGFRFRDVQQQLYSKSDKTIGSNPDLGGFVTNYFSRRASVANSHQVMHYFSPERLPVLTTLAREFAVFNRWFSSIPGPRHCNQMFAHYGTSFGQVGIGEVSAAVSILSVFERLAGAGLTAKFYAFDAQSQLLGVPALQAGEAQFLGTYEQFLQDCESGNLPSYSYLEPNHTDHEGQNGEMAVASDQNPGHHVQFGEIFIASVYNAIRANPSLWESTALLITYDHHCGLYDHVVPPACRPDGFVAPAEETGTGETFAFDRFGVRVPAILVSPLIPKGTVVNEIYEHASIPATVTNFFLGDYEQRTDREKAASTFLDLLSLSSVRTDTVRFNIDGPPDDQSTSGGSLVEEAASTHPQSQTETAGASRKGARARQPRKAAQQKVVSIPQAGQRDIPPPPFSAQHGPSTHVARDRWTTDDSLGHYPYAYAIYRFLTDKETKPPLAVSIQAPWGGGKTSLMRMIQAQLDPKALERVDQTAGWNGADAQSATVKQVLNELDTESTAAPKSGSTRRKPLKKFWLILHSLLPSWRNGAQSSPGRSTDPDSTAQGTRKVTIWFNAWKYESTAQIWAGLADCIVKQYGESLDPVTRELFWFRLQLRRLNAATVRRKIQDEIFRLLVDKMISWLPAYLATCVSVAIAIHYHYWKSAGGALAVVMSAGWWQLWTAKKQTDQKPARISLSEFVQAPDYTANLGFVHEVVEDLKRVFSQIPKAKLPMVIFIDDLDRCSPGKVAAVVEAINLFLAGEFPDCMFILGIDDEMVAAALDKAHSDVIAQLPSYAKSSSIGWRFMDKFVQLPFVIPPSDGVDLTRYIDSLLTQAGAQTGMRARDLAARVIEESGATSPEQVVGKVSASHALAPDQQETLKEEVKIIQDMNENIKRFTDQEEGIRDAISRHSMRYFDNPRDTKRFVNLFRFYYFLLAARQARGQPVPSPDQLCRWLAFSLKWPGVVRWIRRHPTSHDKSSESGFAALERIGGKSLRLETWQEGVAKNLGLKVDQTPWLADAELFQFLRAETSDFEKNDRLSSCSEKGLW